MGIKIANGLETLSVVKYLSIDNYKYAVIL